VKFAACAQRRRRRAGPRRFRRRGAGASRASRARRPRPHGSGSPDGRRQALHRTEARPLSASSGPVPRQRDGRAISAPSCLSSGPISASVCRASSVRQACPLRASSPRISLRPSHPDQDVGGDWVDQAELILGLGAHRFGRLWPRPSPLHRHYVRAWAVTDCACLCGPADRDPARGVGVRVLRHRPSSSVVSVLAARQAGGRWFEPSTAHKKSPRICGGFLVPIETVAGDGLKSSRGPSSGGCADRAELAAGPASPD
jgi:hypothetical protein